MSVPVLPVSTQFQYMIQWFEEWSDFQRQDFLPILAEKIVSNGAYVNGLVDAMNSVNCQDKPMNLFQCRVKLFNDWFVSWTAEDRNNLVKRLSEIDETFGIKLNEEISGNKQVIDGDEPEDHGVVTATPGNVISEDENIYNGQEVEVENREVIDDQDNVAHIFVPDNNIPIQIAE